VGTGSGDVAADTAIEALYSVASPSLTVMDFVPSV
jgi:hypothetical protein